MPLTGLTWARIREHLRKTAPIYLVGAIIMIFLSDILYTSTRPQIPSDQEVLVYLVDGYSQPDLLDDLCADALVYGQQTDDSLLTVHAESIPYTDPETDYASAYVLMARMALGDGDVYLTNAIALEALAGNGCCYPLDDWLNDGWLESLGLEPWYYTETDEDTGEETTYIAALSLDPINALRENGIFENQGAYLVIASNGTNIPTSRDVVTYMLERLAEGTYAPAAAEEPAA